MIIYSEDDNQHRAYKLQNGNYASDGCGRYYGLNVQYVDYDGEKFGLCGTRLSIRAFGGTAPITKLPAFPLKYHPHEEKVKASMIKRRKLFEEYAGYHFKAYDGIALGPGFCGMIKYTVNSRIIIGTYAYNRFCPNRKVSLSRFSQSNEVSYDNDEDDDMDADDCYDYYDEDNNLDTGDAAPKPRRKQLEAETPPLTPDQLLTATHTLRGYSLKDKNGSSSTSPPSTPSSGMTGPSTRWSPHQSKKTSSSPSPRRKLTKPAKPAAATLLTTSSRERAAGLSCCCPAPPVWGRR